MGVSAGLDVTVAVGVVACNVGAGLHDGVAPSHDGFNVAFRLQPGRLQISPRARGRQGFFSLTTSANDAEVGAGGVAQFLRLVRVAARTGLGAFHELTGHVSGVASRCQARFDGKKTGDFGKNAGHIKLPEQLKIAMPEY